MQITRNWMQTLVILSLGSTQWLLAQTQTGDQESSSSTVSSIRLPEVSVVGTNVLREDQLMGANQQPEWTARRRFVTTRVYVQPPWQVETELGYDGSFGRVGKPLHLFQQEIEVGLPYRFQLDVENVVDNFKEGDDAGRKWHHDSNSVELRYALAEWGRIPLNPTVNAEWKFNDGAADAFEFQLLLGEEFSERLHWGLNLFYENQIGDDRIREFAVSQALSYTLIDEKLSGGIEMKFSSESDKDSRADPENKYQVGPSIQWRPTRRTHFDVVPLFGVGPHAPQAELFVFFGIEFGPGSKDAEGVVPASLRGK
jgi:hypothetical protein